MARIVSTPGVCGGDPRIDNTRIPVWLLVRAKQLGRSTEMLLEDYPQLSSDDLAAAWDYASEHAAEIQEQIDANESA